MKEYKVRSCYIGSSADARKVENTIDMFMKEHPDYTIHSMRDVGNALLILFEKDVHEVTTLLND